MCRGLEGIDITGTRLYKLGRDLPENRWDDDKDRDKEKEKNKEKLNRNWPENRFYDDRPLQKIFDLFYPPSYLSPQKPISSAPPFCMGIFLPSSWLASICFEHSIGLNTRGQMGNDTLKLMTHGWNRSPFTSSIRSCLHCAFLIVWFWVFTQPNATVSGIHSKRPQHIYASQGNSCNKTDKQKMKVTVRFKNYHKRNHVPRRPCYSHKAGLCSIIAIIIIFINLFIAIIIQHLNSNPDCNNPPH